MKHVFLIVAVVLVAGLFLFKLGWLERGPSLTRIVPERAAPGSLITLEGDRLGGDPERTLVMFNGVAAETEKVSENAVQVRVPATAHSGLVSALVGDAASNTLFFAVANTPGDETGMPTQARTPRQQMPPGMPPSEMGSSPSMEGGAHEFYDPATARDAIDFELIDKDGKRVKLSDYKGKTLALNFWATWCKPCLDEVPSLERLTKRSGALDVTVLAVSVDKGFDEIEKALPNTNLNILLDPKMEIAHRYGTTKFPETWVISPQGKIVARFIGARNWDSPLFERFFQMVTSGKGMP